MSTATDLFRENEVGMFAVPLAPPAPVNPEPIQRASAPMPPKVADALFKGAGTAIEAGRDIFARSAIVGDYLADAGSRIQGAGNSDISYAGGAALKVAGEAIEGLFGAFADKSNKPPAPDPQELAMTPPAQASRPPALGL